MTFHCEIRAGLITKRYLRGITGMRSDRTVCVCDTASTIITVAHYRLIQRDRTRWQCYTVNRTTRLRDLLGRVEQSPRSHRKFLDWSSEFLIGARKNFPACVSRKFARPHPDMDYAGFDRFLSCEVTAVKNTLIVDWLRSSAFFRPQRTIVVKARR